MTDTKGVHGSMKLTDSEINVMDVLWKEGEVTAKRVASVLHDQTGWNINTTYTLIKRCVAKGAIERIEPNFVCRALITREQVQQQETQELIDRVFGGSADQLFASLLGGRRVSAEQLKKLRAMIEEMD